MNWFPPGQLAVLPAHMIPWSETDGRECVITANTRIKQVHLPAGSSSAHPSLHAHWDVDKAAFLHGATKQPVMLSPSSGHGQSGFRADIDVPFHAVAQTPRSRQMQVSGQPLEHGPFTSDFWVAVALDAGEVEVLVVEVRVVVEDVVLVWTELVVEVEEVVTVVDVEEGAVVDEDDVAVSASALLFVRDETPTPAPTPTPMPTNNATTPRRMKKTHLFMPRIFSPFPVSFFPPRSDPPVSPPHVDAVCASVGCGDQGP